AADCADYADGPNVSAANYANSANIRAIRVIRAIRGWNPKLVGGRESSNSPSASDPRGRSLEIRWGPSANPAGAQVVAMTQKRNARKDRMHSRAGPGLRVPPGQPQRSSLRPPPSPH